MATKKADEKKKVLVNIPMLRKEEGDVYVCVNGKGILIQRGKDVLIDEEYAEVLKHSQKADGIAIRYMAQLEELAAEKKV